MELILGTMVIERAIAGYNHQSLSAKAESKLPAYRSMVLHSTSLSGYKRHINV
jgi:hypothetical protein